MADLGSYLEAEAGRFDEELRAFLRIPSVSTETRYRDDVRRCAEWLADHLREAGVGRAEVVATDGHPIVLAEHEVDPSAPTVLLYGHYDVQPVDPEELWTAPPFDPDERDGRLYARGAVDDKGQVHMHVKALEALERAGDGIPVNVKLVLEGEEEVGSRNLEAFLSANRDRLACDAVLISDTSMFAPDLPCITTGLRGIVYTELTFHGPKSDLHSGSYGGAVANPANALCQVVARLRDDRGRVTIPGFYDDVRPIGEKEKQSMAQLPFDEEAFRAEVGAPALAGEAGYGALERIWFRPTLDVNGLLSGFTGEGAKTVLPSKAMAKVSMRLVPDQDPAAVVESFERHVRALAPDGVSVEIRRYHGGSPWAAEPDHPVFEAAQVALERAFGNPPAFIREGGSIPIVSLFEETFGCPILLVGFALPGSNVHAPDEWIDLGVYHRGIHALVGLYRELATRMAGPSTGRPASTNP